MDEVNEEVKEESKQAPLQEIAEKESELMEEKKASVSAALVDQKLGNWKDSATKWLKNKDNLIVLILILFAIVLRFYVFSITNGQAVWWDEADYLVKSKSVAFGTPTTGWNPAREVFAPFIWGILMMLHPSELLPRLLQVLVSIGVVITAYLFGKEAFNRNVGLIAAFIATVNGMFLFYTGRILTYLWAPFFFLLTFYWFWKGYYNKKGNKYLYLSAAAGAIGIAAYSSMVFGIAALFLFLFITEGFKFLRKKQIWKALLVGLIVVLPHFLYFYFTMGNPFIRWSNYEKTRSALDWSYFFGYFKLFPHLFGTLFAILIAVAAIFVIGEFVIFFDLKRKSFSKGKNPTLFLILWAAVVLGFYTYNGIATKTVWESFIFSAFPALFLMCGVFLNSLYKMKTKRIYITAIIVAILLLGGYSQLGYAFGMIQGKVTSFSQLRDAGNWIKQNTPEDTIVYTTSAPQMTYYSQRHSVRIPDTREQMEAELLNLTGKQSIYAISAFERMHHKWLFGYPIEENLTAINAFFFDPGQTQPAVIIYQLT